MTTGTCGYGTAHWDWSVGTRNSKFQYHKGRVHVGRRPRGGGAVRAHREQGPGEHQRKERAEAEQLAVRRCSWLYDNLDTNSTVWTRARHDELIAALSERWQSECLHGSCFGTRHSLNSQWQNETWRSSAAIANTVPRRVISCPFSPCPHSHARGERREARGERHEPTVRLDRNLHGR